MFVYALIALSGVIIITRYCYVLWISEHIMTLLVSTVNGRKDKNDVLLQELVNAKNWKQALTHCEKRLKKGEKDERLSVRSSDPDVLPARYTKGCS